jgi:hypothetical protein
MRLIGQIVYLLELTDSLWQVPDTFVIDWDQEMHQNDVKYVWLEEATPTAVTSLESRQKVCRKVFWSVEANEYASVLGPSSVETHL